jgi:hypothetical protein
LKKGCHCWQPEIYSDFFAAFFAGAFLALAFLGAAALAETFFTGLFFFGRLTPVEPMWIFPRLDLLSPFPIN